MQMRESCDIKREKAYVHYNVAVLKAGVEIDADISTAVVQLWLSNIRKGSRQWGGIISFFTFSGNFSQLEATLAGKNEFLLGHAF